MSDCSVATSAGWRRSRKQERLPRPVSISISPESGRCGPDTFSTSAPCSASVRAQVGPASTRVRSSTRMPESGRSPPEGSFSGGASPMRSIASSGCDATAADCGWRRHSSALRTRAAQPPAA
jgi:hypothetical protein